MRDEAKWHFEPGVWVGDRADVIERAKDGFRNWQDQTEGWQGGIILSYSGTTFTIRWDDLGPSKLATATCPPFTHNIEFNTVFESELLEDHAAFEGLATHE